MVSSSLIPPRTHLTLQVPISPFRSESQFRLKWTLYHIFYSYFRARFFVIASLFVQVAGKELFPYLLRYRQAWPLPLPSGRQLGGLGTGFPPVLIPLKLIRNLLLHFTRNADFFPEGNC